MRADMLSESLRLRAEGVAFALATVVAATLPTSGQPGDRAIIRADSSLQGWIGGSCAQPTVIRQALASLVDGQPRLVQLSPDILPDEGVEAVAQPRPVPAASPDSAGAMARPRLGGRAGIVPVAMTCAGQGELQIFIEPFLPRVGLVVIGDSPVARALVQLGSLLDFAVWACDPAADMARFPDAERLIQQVEDLQDQLTARQYVVVATFGHYDEIALQVALAGPASYIGLVAGQRRMASVQEYLQERGVAPEAVARIRRPLGLPGRTLQAREIALSVIAELVALRQQRIGQEPEVVMAPPRATAIDPICGMTVDSATAIFKTERQGQMYYFCCAGCQAQFKAEGAMSVAGSLPAAEAHSEA